MTISTFSVFYLLAPLFIWVEIFGFLNRDKVYKRLNLESIENFNYRLYLLFYFSKIAYLIWILCGCFSNLQFYFIFLASLGFFRGFITLTKSRFIVNLYDFLNPTISVIILIIILIQALFQ